MRRVSSPHTCTTRFVDVPMTVSSPPMMHEYDSGIRNMDGENPRARAQSLVMGISSATTGVLLRNAERMKHRAIMRPRPAAKDVRSPKTFLAALSASCDFSTPLMTTKRAPAERHARDDYVSQ